MYGYIKMVKLPLIGKKKNKVYSDLNERVPTPATSKNKNRHIKGVNEKYKEYSEKVHDIKTMGLANYKDKKNKYKKKS